MPPANSVHGKVIVITGAASGMGLEASKYLASQGALVSLADVQEEALKQVAASIEEFEGKVLSRVVDIRNRTQVEEWIKATVDTFGKIDGCANLAGVIGKQNGLANIEEIEDESFDFVMDVNVKGLLNCMRAQIPNMNDGGSILNASSILGLQGMKKGAAYVASKHAVIVSAHEIEASADDVLTESIGLDEDRSKRAWGTEDSLQLLQPVSLFSSLTLIYHGALKRLSGIIDTPMLHHSASLRGTEMKLDHLAINRRGQPIEVAYLIEFLLSDASAYISGTCQSIDGGWHC